MLAAHQEHRPQRLLDGVEGAPVEVVPAGVAGLAAVDRVGAELRAGELARPAEIHQIAALQKHIVFTVASIYRVRPALGHIVQFFISERFNFLVHEGIDLLQLGPAVRIQLYTNALTCPNMAIFRMRRAKLHPTNGGSCCTELAGIGNFVLFNREIVDGFLLTCISRNNNEIPDSR